MIVFGDTAQRSAVPRTDGAGLGTILTIGVVGFLAWPHATLGTGSSFTVSVPADTTAGTKVTDVTIAGMDANGDPTPFEVDDDGAFTSTVHSSSKKTWTLDGASLAPGGSTTIKIHGAALASVLIAAWSWEDSSGNPQKGTELPDPVGCAAVFGGDEGVTFLSVSIPAGHWGYFYQVFNNGSDPIERATFQNRAPNPPSGFVVLPNAYPTAYLDEYPAAYDERTWALSAFDYMAEGEATGTGTSLTSWFFDSENGEAVAEFAVPIAEGETSSLFGFISDAGPHDAMLDVNETVQLFSTEGTPVCPKAQNGLVPTAPGAFEVPALSPAALTLMALLVLGAGAVVFYRRRRAERGARIVCQCT